MQNSLHYLKWPLLLLLAGFLLRITGAMMKILHWRGADIGLRIATVVIIISILWLMVKVFLVKKQKV